MNYLSNFGKKGRNVNSFLAFLLFVCLSVMPAIGAIKTLLSKSNIVIIFQR